MLCSILIEVSIAIMLAGFSFGAPSLNDVDPEEKPYDLKDADVYYDQRQNGTENYKINLDGVSIIWTPLSSLVAAASGLLDAPFGTDQFTENQVNNLLFKANKHSEKSASKDSKNVEEANNKPLMEILPIEIIEDGSKEAKSEASVELIEESKVRGHKNSIRKRKFSISDLLKPFSRRAVLRSNIGI